MIVGALGFSPAVMLRFLLDYILLPEYSGYLYIFCIAIVVLYIIKGIAAYTQSYLMSWVGQNVIMDMRNRVFNHLSYLSMRFYKENTTGELISRVTNDISLMEMAVSKVLGRLVLSFFSFFPPLFYVFYLSWKMALLAIIVLPATLYPILKFARKLKKVSSAGQEQIAGLTSTMSEAFYGIQIIKAFTMERFQQKRFQQHNRKYYNAIMKGARVSALSSPLMELIGAMSAAVLFGIGAHLVINNSMTQGTLMSFIASLFLMYDPVKKLSRVNYDIQRAIAGAERVFQLLDTKPEITVPEHAERLENVRGLIEFRDVSFEYDKGEPVLRNVSLTIQPSEMIAIVGPSGAGKSTLVSLLMRFYDPTEGKILIDGHDLRNLTLESLRGSIGIVTQETILFNDTIFNNLSCGRKDISQEAVIQAAKAAFAHDFIMELPDGYQTRLGDRGINLSGGQRQRLSIARALLKNPPILILDEATSSLDSESETLIQQAIDRLIQNRTTIVIAHRLSTIRNSDRIIAMDKGEIVESGTHDSLIEKKGVYQALYNFQFQQSSSSPG